MQRPVMNRGVLSTWMMLVLTVGAAGCGPASEQPSAAPGPSPSPSSTWPAPETERLWISEREGKRQVIGWIQPSPTRIAIEYDLQIIPVPSSLTIDARFPDDDLFAQSGPIHGERSQRGYISINDPDDDIPVFSHPKAFELVVFFNHGQPLTARFSSDPPAK